MTTLEKIRAEICEMRSKQNCSCSDCLDIIDKYAEQEPKMGHCKDCKYFEYDKMMRVDGIPRIVTLEICNKWGDGCKTKEEGYCFLFEPQEGEV